MPDQHRRSRKEALHNSLVSETVAEFLKKDPKEKTVVSNIVADFHENGFILALIFFALPVAIPLPYPPGFTTIMGAPLILLAIQMLFGYEQVKLPAKVANFAIKNSTLIMIAKKAVPILQWLEKFLKPRFNFASYVFGEQLIGFLTLICALAIAVPLPFTNSIPAWGIVIMSLGMIKHDGLVIIVGMLVGIFGLTIAIIATLAAIAGIKHFIFMWF